METNPLDLYTVPDIPYTPQELNPVHIRDKFEGYRALTMEDLSVWNQVIEECGK